MQLAKSEYEKGHEFPHLLKLEPVRSAIKILKKIDADLHKLQEEMEGAYELCKGCLQEKYGKKSKKLPQGKNLTVKYNLPRTMDMIGPDKWGITIYQSLESGALEQNPFEIRVFGLI